MIDQLVGEYETSSLLNDGRVLVAGGEVSGGARTPNTEVSVPASCSPGWTFATTFLARGATVTCSFSPPSDAVFDGWSTVGYPGQSPLAPAIVQQGFNPSTSPSLTQTFKMTAGAYKLRATYHDSDGSHDVDFLYAIAGPPFKLRAPWPAGQTYRVGGWTPSVPDGFFYGQGDHSDQA
jgi:hypothetical protein